MNFLSVMFSMLLVLRSLLEQVLMLIPTSSLLKRTAGAGETGGTGGVWAFEKYGVVLFYSAATTESVSPAISIWEHVDGGEMTLTYAANTISSSVAITTPNDINGTIIDIDELSNSVIIELATVIDGFEKYDFGNSESSSFDGTAGGSMYSPIKISSAVTANNDFSNFLNISQEEFVYMAKGSAGSADTADGDTKMAVANTRKSLLVKAFRGTLNEGVVMKKFYPFDIVLDANLDDAVKTAINDLTRTREDFMFIG